MYLMRQIGADGQYRVNMPDFMVFLAGRNSVQWWNSDQFWWCALLVVLVPVCSHSCLLFRIPSRVKGVYFSIITQALPMPRCCCSSVTLPGLAKQRLYRFQRVLGYPITTPETRMVLSRLPGAVLIAMLLLARYIVKSSVTRAHCNSRCESRSCSRVNTLFGTSLYWTLSAVLLR